MLHRVGQLEDPSVQPVEDLQADTGADLRPGVAPCPHPGAGRREQRVDVGHPGVADAQVEAERRPLGRDAALAARGVQRERSALQGLEGGLALGGGVLAVHARGGRLVEGGVVAAAGAGRHGGVEAVAVLGEEVRAHGATQAPRHR